MSLNKLTEVDSAVGFKITLGNYEHNGDLLLNSSSLFVGSKYNRQKITPKSRVPDHQGALVSMGAGDITGLFPDDLSSRIIVICGREVHMLHLTNRERKQDLVHCFTIPFTLAQVLQNLEHEKESVSEVRRQLHLCQLRLEETSYNDSLGVLMVTGTLTVGELMGGVVSLYDDSTGRHLRSVLLEPLSNKYTCQTMKMQGDTIVRILEFHDTDIQEVQVYRLSSH
ncbi:uncharacterized protein LOC143280358 [Babylonia areolata]|uniref:uncharacterized protein LOC143280358 n=1 Tax=Babylonia areolata TaxID=304850 RepID=UPI003FD1D052